MQVNCENVSVDVPDDAHPEKKPLTIRLIVEGYGAALVAVGNDGQEIGRVAIDYHDNKLQALVYEGKSDNPHMVVGIVDDVDAARGK